MKALSEELDNIEDGRPFSYYVCAICTNLLYFLDVTWRLVLKRSQRQDVLSGLQDALLRSRREHKPERLIYASK